MTLVNTATGEVVADCTPDEARGMVEQMVATRDQLWRLAIESHDRKAWAALGYSSWRAFIKAEVGVESSQAYRLLDQGRTMLALASHSPMGESLPTTERQTRPLAKLPEPERPAAWTEAVEEAASEDRAPTAKDVQRVVQRRTESTTTETPATDDAEKINAAFAKVADPAADTRRLVFREVDKAFRSVTTLDIDRAALASDGTERSHVAALRDWCDRYLAATEPTHLRSV